MNNNIHQLEHHEYINTWELTNYIIAFVYNCQQVKNSDMINEIIFNSCKNLGPITTMKMQKSKQTMIIVKGNPK